MSRLHFKGGPWTNAEDEVLKAALAQYGLRDWERVASMLTKKTATQCRERWENYIDPRLNIHEAWSLEEEEKLVELQSLFPNKFRLIAEQLTRRTPTHYIRPAWLCEQRYLELKDEQEHYAQQQKLAGKEDAEKQTLDAFMAERRRRRNARKTHEERAARADTISGERFESEMVAMATSRLANQDQKKGLRKERQRQLDEAVFLAKLESNREGIESGTLSLRQSKKMRKALDEDRKASGVVDMVEEDEEGEGSDGEVAKGGRSDGDDSGSESFEAIDMYEDQQQAGLVKKQRVLMKDLTAQQRMIQERQMLRGDDDGDDDQTGDNSSSRARAAITGVNQDLLKQLTAGPATKALSSASTAVPLVRDRASSTLAGQAAAEAQSDLKNTLADLFAALPQASTAAAGSGMLPPPLPPPPQLKRPRDDLPAVPTAQPSVSDVADTTTSSSGVAEVQATGSRHVPLVSSSSTKQRWDGSESKSNGVPVDLFSSIDLPAPRKHFKSDVDAAVDRPKSPDAPEDAQAPTPTTTAAATDGGEAKPALVAFRTQEEEDAYMDAARQWVAVECEKAATASTRATAAPPALSPADRAAAEALIALEVQRDLFSSPEAQAVLQAYVTDTPAYTARVNVQSALHQLSAQVAAQVREANNVLQPLRQEWERVMSVAMLDPRQLHVLQGYVHDDGQLKGSATTGAALSENASQLAQASVAAYVYERLVNDLTRARQATRFLSSLRDREQQKMRRDLDAVEHDLQQLQARERRLQDMYREKRAQL